MGILLKIAIVFMKINNTLVCLCKLLSILLIFGFSGKTYALARDGAPSKPLLRVGINDRSFLQYMNESGECQGLDIELSKLIFTEAGFDVEFTLYPWQRVLYLLEQGKIDVALSTANTQERRRFARFSRESFRPGHVNLYTLKNKTRLLKDAESLSDLATTDVQIAVLRGASYSLEYDNLLNKSWFSNKLLVLDTHKRIIEALFKGHVDAAIGSEYGAPNWAREFGNDNQLVMAFPLLSDKEAETHIMYSKVSVSESQVTAIDKTMARLKNDGRYETVIYNFLRSDAVPKLVTEALITE